MSSKPWEECLLQELKIYRWRNAKRKQSTGVAAGCDSYVVRVEVFLTWQALFSGSSVGLMPLVLIPFRLLAPTAFFLQAQPVAGIQKELFWILSGFICDKTGYSLSHSPHRSFLWCCVGWLDHVSSVSFVTCLCPGVDVSSLICM